MGEFIRKTIDGETRCFTPDDTDNAFYMNSDWTAVDTDDIQHKINEKWPGLTLADVNIEARYIHTNCIGHDRYDPIDYTNYLLVTRKYEVEDKPTKRMFYCTRYEHNVERQTEYYTGGGSWATGVFHEGWERNNRLSLRLYEDEEMAKAIIKDLTECDWHDIEICK